MRSSQWELRLGVGLVSASVILHALHLVLFRDAHHIAIYLLGDLAFLPLQVLLVTLVLGQVLREREKTVRLGKLQMVIGAFFSEVGNGLLAAFVESDSALDTLRDGLQIDVNWSADQFRSASAVLRRYPCAVAADGIDLALLRAFLLARRAFLLGLLENPSLLDHESFTDLLRAVFHLTEELEARPNLTALPRTDLAHLSGDLQRAYKGIVGSWLDYMRYLKDQYPYLFSLAVRTNPFDRSASAMVA